MKTLYIILFSIFMINNINACDFFKAETEKNLQNMMGKKSKFYDAYKQGKCVLEDALKTLPAEQREVIANLIARSYTIEN